MASPPETVQMLAAVPLPMVMIAPDGCLIWANEGGEALFGGGLAGLHFTAILRQPGPAGAIEAALAGHGRREARYRHATAGGESLYRVSVAPVPLPRELAAEGAAGSAAAGGETGSREAGSRETGSREAGGRGVLVCFEDVTPLEEAMRMRQDFVANVSHELRSPLTAMLGFIETLRGPAREDPGARERFLALMAAEAARMERLIGDLLSLARVEAGERRAPAGRVELGALIGEVVDRFSGKVAEGGAKLEFTPPDAPLRVAGDGDQLRQVFINLIENALKYGARPGAPAQGQITLARRGTPRGPEVVAEVADRGPGIEAHHIPRLTERFYRVDDHRARETGGTGLGLAIVKHILNRHRGRLKIESTPGAGSRFQVILPLAEGPEAEGGAEGSAEGRRAEEGAGGAAEGGG